MSLKRSPREFLLPFHVFSIFKKLSKNWQSPKLRYVSTRDKKTFWNLEGPLEPPKLNVLSKYSKNLYMREKIEIEFNGIYSIWAMCVVGVLCCLQLSQSIDSVTWHCVVGSLRNLSLSAQQHRYHGALNLTA